MCVFYVVIQFNKVLEIEFLGLNMLLQLFNIIWFTVNERKKII